MLIRYLRIENGTKLIRNIPFKYGVNLIIDETPTEDLKESGNNVGKTTTLNLIDYCLGAQAKKIYQDREFKTYSKIKNFLEENNIIITLCLCKSLKDNSEDVIIRRNFLTRNQKIAEINGTNFSNGKEFRQKLKSLLFNLSTPKPTLRQLIPRYIRSDSGSMDRVIKYLNQATTNTTYEIIYRTLFTRTKTVGLSEDKNLCQNKIEFNESIIEKTFNNRTSGELEQHLELVNKQIKKLDEDKALFATNPNYEEEVQELRFVKKNIETTTTELTAKQYRLDLLAETIEKLQNQTSHADFDALKNIYKEAGYYIEKLQKSFTEVVGFHNKLIENKKEFISKEIPELELKIADVGKELKSLLKREKKLTDNLIKTGSLSEYEALVEHGNKKYEQKGRLEEEFDKLEKLETEIKINRSKIENIVNKIKEEDEIFKNEIKAFNEFFSSYSEKFYGEQFALIPNYDDKDNVYKFSITNIDGAVGDGKKKAIIAAFDLAYIAFASKKNMATPQFIIHDRIEGIHGNQLKSLFDVINDSDFPLQYVVSVLRGKFKESQLLSSNYLDNNQILELSQSDKLFKVPD